MATQLDGGRDEEVSAVGKFDHQPCLTSPLWDRRQEKTEVIHHHDERVSVPRRGKGCETRMRGNDAHGSESNQSDPRQIS